MRRAYLLSGTTAQRPFSFRTSTTEPLCAIISTRVCSGVCAARLASAIASTRAVSAASSAASAASSSVLPSASAFWRASAAAFSAAGGPASSLAQPGNISSCEVYSWFECRRPCSELSEPRGSGK
jgi:hypothetical protein